MARRQTALVQAGSVYTRVLEVTDLEARVRELEEAMTKQKDGSLRRAV